MRTVSLLGVLISAFFAYILLTIDVGLSQCHGATCASVGTLVLAPGKTEHDVHTVLNALRFAGTGWVGIGLWCLTSMFRDSDVPGIATIVVLIFAACVLFAAIQGAYASMFLHVGRIPVYAALIVMISCLVLGIVIFLFRDLLGWTSVAVVQIAVGVLVGTVGFFDSQSMITGAAALLAGVVIVADGAKRLWEIRSMA
jgi:hypothetical protein